MLQRMISCIVTRELLERLGNIRVQLYAYYAIFYRVANGFKLNWELTLKIDLKLWNFSYIFFILLHSYNDF